jgi:hypothetical protein
MEAHEQEPMQRRKIMNYYPDFDYYLIKERNEMLLSEKGTRWLEKRPQRDCRTSALRLIAFASKSRSPLLRRVGLARR